MSCLEKILARVVSHCLPRSLGFGVSFSHDGRVLFYRQVSAPHAKSIASTYSVGLTEIELFDANEDSIEIHPSMRPD